jgi:hypothetical protein
MPASAEESCEDNRIRSPGSTAAIVLSSSCRLLFIDRNAIDLLRALDPDWRNPTEAQSLPTCLMTMVKEIAATRSTIGADCHVPLVQVSRLLGPPLQPVRVQGFTVPGQGRPDRRIVLVLSRSNHGTAV